MGSDGMPPVAGTARRRSGGGGGGGSRVHPTRGRLSLYRNMEAEASPPSPWQAPPPWLAARLLAHLLTAELRWPVLVADLRCISRGWRAAVGEELPGLAVPPIIPADEAAAVAAHCPGLRVLQLNCPGEARLATPLPHACHESDVRPAAVPCCLAAITGATVASRFAEQSAALAAICAACTGLRSLIINDWWLEAEGLHPLSKLGQLRELVLNDVDVAPGAAWAVVLPPLPLQHLRGPVGISIQGGHPLQSGLVADRTSASGAQNAWRLAPSLPLPSPACFTLPRPCSHASPRRYLQHDGPDCAAHLGHAVRLRPAAHAGPAAAWAAGAWAGRHG